MSAHFVICAIHGKLITVRSSASPWITKKLMDHVGEGVTGQHYDRPDWELFADSVAEAYSKHPFANDRDKLGRENIMHTV